MLLHELGYGRPEMQRSKGHRGVYTQHPAWLRLQPRDGDVRFLQLRKDRNTAFVIGEAVVRRARAARGPVEQLDPQLPLEIDHVLADSRAREVRNSRAASEKLPC